MRGGGEKQVVLPGRANAVENFSGDTLGATARVARVVGVAEETDFEDDFGWLGGHWRRVCRFQIQMANALDLI
jgi:hypothetical protein